MNELINIEKINNIMETDKNNMEKRTVKISLETAKEWYKGNDEVLKKLALQAFTENELQTHTCVRSWEEFRKKYNVRNNEYYIDTFSEITTVNGSCNSLRDATKDRNLLATKEDAEEFLALIQLKRLRDQWWKSLNWKPDYTNNDYKYIIIANKNEIDITFIYTYHEFLAFPTKEIAEDFLDCFRDLIEKAKELI